MRHELKNLSENILRAENQEAGTSALFFMSKKESLKSNILEQAKELMEEKKIDMPIAMLSEAHQKPVIKSPTGAIISSSKYIFPEVMDAAPNCGMRIIKTDLRDDEMTDEKITRLFKEMQRSIPTGGLYGKIIPKKLVEEIFIKGSSALAEKFAFRTKNELENTHEKGNFFNPESHRVMENPLHAVPGIISWIGKFRLNLLGATKSHFIYLAKISDIADQEKADLLGLRKNQYVFFMHTGSSIVGRYTASLYSPRKIKSFLQRSIITVVKMLSPQKLRSVFPETKKNNTSPLLPIEGESLEGKMLFSALGAVNNYGFANRALITHSLDLTLEKTFDRKISLDLLYDAPHVFLSHERQGEKDLWVHRNGANRAFGPKIMSGHPIFKNTGEPVLIAPFEETPGYIGVGTDENSLAYFSANHEIGKAKDLSIPPEQYKNHAEKIVWEMQQNKLIKLVATVKPIKVLTY